MPKHQKSLDSNGNINLSGKTELIFLEVFLREEPPPSYFLWVMFQVHESLNINRLYRPISSQFILLFAI